MLQPQLKFDCKTPQSLVRPALPDAVACAGVLLQPRCFHLLSCEKSDIPRNPPFCLPHFSPRRARSAAQSSLLRPLPDDSRKVPHTAKHGLTGGTAA